MSALQSTRFLSAVCNKPDLVRLLSCSNGRYGKPLNAAGEARRSAKMLQKILTGSKRAARKPDQSHPSKHLKDFGFMQNKGTVSGQHKPVSGRLLRRVDMLNNLFIEQITSLLATGEVSPEFLGMGIQIARVKVTPDFSAVNVYWYASGTEKDEEIELLLIKSSGHLRHMLSRLRVIGVVPPINFYKDKTFSKLQEVEMLLSKCSIPAQETDVEAVNAEDMENGSSQEIESAEKDDEDTMRQDILGVRHDFIMNEIQKSLQRQSERKKAREQNIQTSILNAETLETELDPKTGDLEHAIAEHRQRQSEFLKYLKRQNAEKAKLLKQKSTGAKEREFYREVVEDRVRNQLLNRLDELDMNKEEEDSDDELTAYHEVEEMHYKDLRESFK